MQYRGEDAAYVAYEMDGKPISLLISSSSRVTPSGSESYRSEGLAFYFSSAHGLRIITLKDTGLTYAQVSDLTSTALSRARSATERKESAGNSRDCEKCSRRYGRPPLQKKCARARLAQDRYGISRADYDSENFSTRVTCMSKTIKMFQRRACSPAPHFRSPSPNH